MDKLNEKSRSEDQDISGQGISVSVGQVGMLAGFERLWVWQRAYQLMLEVHEVCRTLPREERFRKRDQLERSSSSVADNIAEGYSSYYYQDKIKGFNVARKEAGETQNHLRALMDKRYLEKAQARLLITRYEEIMRGINGYIRWVREKRGDRK